MGKMTKTGSRILSLFLCLAMAGSMVVPVYASTPSVDASIVSGVDNDTATTGAETTADEAESASTPSETESSESTEQATNISSDLFVAMAGEIREANLFTFTFSAKGGLGKFTKALNQETVEQIEGALAIYASLSDADKETEAVKAAYDKLMDFKEQIRTFEESENNNTEPETEGETSAIPEQSQVVTGPELEVLTKLYANDLPDKPTGYYISEEFGVPVLAGETKLAAYVIDSEPVENENLDSTLSKSELDKAPEKKTYEIPYNDVDGGALVDLTVEVEYPANKSEIDISVPDAVDVLTQNVGDDENPYVLVTDAAARRSMLHKDMVDTSAAIYHIYLKSDEAFDATITYRANDGQEMVRELRVEPKMQNPGIAPVYFVPMGTGSHIDAQAKVSGHWMMSMSNSALYCRDHGLRAYAKTSQHDFNAYYSADLAGNQYSIQVEAHADALTAQHVANQLSIWGGASPTGVSERKETISAFSLPILDEKKIERIAELSGYRKEVVEKAVEDLDTDLLYMVENYPESKYTNLMLGYIEDKYFSTNSGIMTVAGGDEVYEEVTPLTPAIQNSPREGELRDNQRFYYVYGYGGEESAGSHPTANTSDVTFNYSVDAAKEYTGSTTVTYTVQVDTKHSTIDMTNLANAVFAITSNRGHSGSNLFNSDRYTSYLKEKQAFNGPDSYSDSWTMTRASMTTNGAGFATATLTFTFTARTEIWEGVYTQSGFGSAGAADAAAEARKRQAEESCEDTAKKVVEAACRDAEAWAATWSFHVSETSSPTGFGKTGAGLFSNPIDSGEPGEQDITVNANSSNSIKVENENWNGHITWEKVDYLTGGRLTEDTQFEFLEWNGSAYVVSPNYKVIRRADGIYTTQCINPSYRLTGSYASNGNRNDDGNVFYTLQNQGKYGIREVAQNYGYTADESVSDKTPWEIYFTISGQGNDQQFTVDGNTPGKTDANRSWRTRLFINKTDSETGKPITAESTYTLYEWNEQKGAFEVSTNYAIKRIPSTTYNGQSERELSNLGITKDSYTIVPLNYAWRNRPEDGWLAFEDTLGDARTATDNDNDHTQETHPQYYTGENLQGDGTEGRSDRAYTNDGEFIIVEHKAPSGYYGDWTDVNDPDVAGQDIGKRAYYLRITEDLDNQTVFLSNNQWNADIVPQGSQTGSNIILEGGVNATVVITDKGLAKADASKTYNTDNSTTAESEDTYTMTPNVSYKDGPVNAALQEQNKGKLDKNNVLQNDRILGEISLSKIDLDAVTYVSGSEVRETAYPSGKAHGDAVLDGAKYDLYAADDISHPDGKTGIVDYSKIKYNSNHNNVETKNIWHTSVLRNSGVTDDNYLPVLKKDHLVATGTIEDGWMTFSNLYLGRYYLVERGTGITIPVVVTAPDGSETVAEGDTVADATAVYGHDGKYPDYTFSTKATSFNKPTKTGSKVNLGTSGSEYTDYIYRNRFTTSNKQTALNSGGGGVAGGSSATYDNLYISFAEGYLCDETNHYTTLSYTTESSYIEKNTFVDDREDAGDELDGMMRDDEYEEYVNIHNSDTLESSDQVMKGNVTLRKMVSGEGTTNGGALENAGFTLFLISDLSKVKEYEEMYGDDFFLGIDGKYDVDRILQSDKSAGYEGYLNPTYANAATNKYAGLNRVDEEKAIARTYEIDADQIEAFNKAMTQDDGIDDDVEYRYGKGEGWVETGWTSNTKADNVTPTRDAYGKEYILSELFTNQDGFLRIEGLPYGQYLLVETTIPDNLEVIEPILVDIDPNNSVQLQSHMADPSGEKLTPSDGSDTLLYLDPLVDQEVQFFVTIYKHDAETGERVLLPNTAFQIYRLNEDGSYVLDDNGTLRDPSDDYPKPMTFFNYNGDPLQKTANVFYTDERGFVTLPEEMEVGKYRIVEVKGPEGYYNEWLDAPNQWLDAEHPYKDGIDYESGLYKDADGNWYVGTYYVDFDVTTNTLWHATGEQNNAGADTLLLDEAVTSYYNHETLGIITVHKDGSVLAGVVEKEVDPEEVDPEYTMGTSGYDFKYEDAPLPNATYRVSAYEDIYTPDHQVDEDGNRTVWYKKGDTVVEMKTGTFEEENSTTFAPSRTHATYDFLEVRHDGKTGEVCVTLPLGKYLVEEITAPYGFSGTTKKYLVTIEWSNELQDYVFASEVVAIDEDGKETTETFDVTDAVVERSDTVDVDRESYRFDAPHAKRDGTITGIDGGDGIKDEQIMMFYNRRQPAQIEVYKYDEDEKVLLEGARFNLYTEDDIYDAFGNKLFEADDLIATSEPTDKEGHTVFYDVPIRGEKYLNGVHEPAPGEKWSATYNSGNYYLVELTPPNGFYLDTEPKHVEVLYQTDTVEVNSIAKNVTDVPNEIYVSKKKLTGDDELPDATLTVLDPEGKTVATWVSGKEPHRVYGLAFATVYTLRETRPANGYAVADDIQFMLIQKQDEDGNFLMDTEVYVWQKIRVEDEDEEEETPGPGTQPTPAPGETEEPKEEFIEDWVLMDDYTVVMRDDITKVYFSKRDITNDKELPGAKLSIRDERGNVIQEWVSTDKPHYIEMLAAGVYYLHEDAAPAGFNVASDVKFEIKPTGEIQYVVMKDYPDNGGPLYGIIEWFKNKTNPNRPGYKTGDLANGFGHETTLGEILMASAAAYPVHWSVFIGVFLLAVGLVAFAISRRIRKKADSGETD